MNLFELIWLVIMIASGCFGFMKLDHVAGPIAAGVGFVAGVCVPLFGVLGLSKLGDREHPTHPVCICGSNNYVAESGTFSDQKEFVSAIIKCQVCGRRYETFGYDIVLLLDDSGRTIPYMRRQKNGHFKLEAVSDESGQTPSQPGED